MVLDTGDLMNSNVETFLANLLERNEERYKEFYKQRSAICDIPITDIIKTYKLEFPGNVTIKSEKAQLQATEKSGKWRKVKNSLQQELLFLYLFSNEVTNLPSALTEGGSMYHSSKLDFFKQFKQIPEVILELPFEKKCNGRRLISSCQCPIK